ncbi:MAG: thiamine pyrophosphate-dependent dehydrogenase E1 component subunit alpha [Deltaproteobacteria bacterium]|nr:thiamine pyrophosphate-dependent dehydrogenase E1 component subunit alpha [Deltaproteobacteria bacterium]
MASKARKATPKTAASVAKNAAVATERDRTPLCLVNPDGSVVKGAKLPVIPDADLKRLFEVMLQNREIDERMLTVQRQGRIGFYMQSRGEEGSILGAAYATTKADWLFLCYRELASLLWRGMTLQTFANQLFGNRQDLVKGRQMPCHYTDRAIGLVSISSPVSTQIPQAAGVGWAMKLKGEENVSLCFMGEGGTAEGDFHCGMNFAAVYKANVVFVCRNNGWAISTPAEVQSASETFAMKARAYGMPGVLVDGGDIFAMIAATREAVERARKGEGPTLIEARTYRFSAHSSSDDPSVYRDEKADQAKFAHMDPLPRLRNFLKHRELWSQEWEQSVVTKIQDQLATAIKLAETMDLPQTETVFEDVYKELPWHLREEKNEALRHKQKPVHGVVNATSSAKG